MICVLGREEAMAEMIDSILNSTKKALGIEPDYEHFDPELIMHINSIFMVLHQLGVGPKEPFRIESENETWDEFLEDKTNLDAAKTFMHLRVRLIFDPPSSSFVAESYQKIIDECEWRLTVGAETTSIGGEEETDVSE